MRGTRRTMGHWLALLALGGCGGTDDPPVQAHGIERSVAMQDLTDEQRTAYCEWSTEERGGPGYAEDCGDYSYVVESVADCLADTIDYGTCGLTVGQLDDCTEDVGAHLCTFSQEVGQPCAPLAACP